jgi:hypothetical protein
MATLTRVRRRGVVARAGSVVTRARSDPFPVALAPSPGHSNDHRPAVRPSLRTTMDQTHPDCIWSPAKAAGPGGVSLDDFLDEVSPSALHLTPLLGHGRYASSELAPEAASCVELGSDSRARQR